MPYGYGYNQYGFYQPPVYYAYSHPLLKYTGVTPLYAIASEPSPFEPSYTPSYGRGVIEVRTESTRA
ncbi:MAG: hypothetical protein U0531_13410 [Dehalococcoidia bacterium]